MEPVSWSWEPGNDSAIGVITLESAGLTKRSLDLLEEALQAMAKSAARVVLLRGQPLNKHFCVGLDLAAFDFEAGHSMEDQERFSSVFALVGSIPQPVIALVHGAAAGGGFSLALTCDVILASKDASFNAAFLRIGLSGCELGTSFFLPKLAGKNAAYAMLTGEPISAERAYALNFVSQVVSDPRDLFQQGMALAKLMIKSSSPLGLALTKRQIRSATDGGSYAAVVHAENVHQMYCTRDPATRNWTANAVSRWTAKKQAKL